MKKKTLLPHTLYLHYILTLFVTTKRNSCVSTLPNKKIYSLHMDNLLVHPNVHVGEVPYCYYLSCICIVLFLHTFSWKEWYHTTIFRVVTIIVAILRTHPCGICMFSFFGLSYETFLGIPYRNGVLHYYTLHPSS
jgi:hypothetical protein